MIGKTISHYKIIEKLGAGGMGIVYKAEDTKLNRFVALKFLPLQSLSNEEDKTRFVHEAQAAASLDHPNICTVHEIDEVEGNTFIAMAYIDGQSLKGKIDSGPLKIEESLNITIQIAEGLQEAHETGIVHRDIKSSNIMFSSKGQIKITDFGLAKFSGRSKVTKTGTTIGTVDYMSPEQAQGLEVDHRTDIWSLGVVLYEMVNGQLPFRGDYDQAVVYSIVNEEPPGILDLRREITVELAQVVEKALVKRPEERYQSVEELLADLQAIREKIEAGDSRMTIEERVLPSIAVLPFANMSADKEQEYFCDGMTEELINALTKIENLHVPARTSAFAFKGEKIDVRDIGKKLNVTTILEGSVRKAGNRLRITAQLINVADGYHLWSERYDRELNDVFAIQDEISMAIVDNLKVSLLHGEKQKLVKHCTDNLEAYNLYLKGRYYWNSFTPEGWGKSYECYQQAIAIDPNYALAYLGQSIWHISQGFWADAHPREAYEKGRELAEQALALDNSLSSAHSCLGIVYWAYDWNRPEAQKEFQKSLESEDIEVFGFLNYALFLACGKEFDEALLLAKKIQLLDPFSSLLINWAASIYSYAGKYDESTSQLLQIIASDPDPWQPYYNLSVAYIYQNKFEEAVSAAEESVKRSGGAAIAKTILGCAFALAGREEKAREQLIDLLERSSEKYVPPTFFVWLYNALNEVEEAYVWIEKGVKDHDLWLCFYWIHPHSLLASDPRFNNLLEKNALVV
jgi:serine/threonine protein kinase